MSEQIKPEELTAELEKILIKYGEACDAAVEKAAKSAMTELVEATKKDAPFNEHSKEHYRDQIASKQTGRGKHKHSYLWYVNGDKYRVSHLLDKGHAKRGGGRVEGDGHVTNNAKRIIAEYEKKVKEEIRNAKP